MKMERDHRVEPNNRRIAKNTVFLYLRLIIAMAVTFYSTRVVLNALGIEDYGIYSIVCGFVSMFGFLNTSITNGIQRFYNYKLGIGGNQAVVDVYNIALLIQSFMAIVIAILLGSFGYWYLNNEMVIPPERLNAANIIFLCSIISLILLVIQSPFSAAIMAYEKMDYYAVVNIVDSFIKLGIAISLTYISSDRLILYGIMIMFVQLLNLILYYGYCKYHFPHLKIGKSLDKKLFVSIFSFSGWNSLGSFALMLKGQGTNLLLNAFGGAIINAASGVASQIGTTIQAFSLNLIVAFQPQFTQSYAVGDYKRTQQLMLWMSKISYILFCLMAIPLVVDMDYVLKLWLGDNVPEHTATFSILMIIGIGICLFHTTITQTFHAIGNVKTFQIITSLIVCSILPIGWLFLKLGAQIDSVYTISIFVYIANLIVCVALLYHYFKFDIKQYAVMILKCALFTILLSIVPLQVRNAMQPSFLRFICVLFSTLITSVFVSLIILNRDEISMVKKMIQTKLFKHSK